MPDYAHTPLRPSLTATNGRVTVAATAESPPNETSNGRMRNHSTADLADEQQALADNQAWAELQAAISSQLDRLLVLGKKEYQKRRNTVTAVAWAAVTPGMSINQALSQPGTVSRGIFYNPEKDWHHNSLFQEVLTAVTDLVRGYEEGRARRLLEWRRRHFMERTYQLSVRMLDRAEEMNAWPLAVEIQEEDEQLEDEADEDGRIIRRTLIRRTTIEPAGWNQNTAGMHLVRATKVGRQALGLDSDDGIEDELNDNPVVIVRREEWDAL